MKVSGSVVGKIPLGELTWAVTSHGAHVIEESINAYLRDQGARVCAHAHPRARDYGLLPHARAHATGPS